MKTIKADLLEEVVSSYDKTKTTIYGNVFVDNGNEGSLTVPPNLYVDVFTDAAITPLNCFMTPNNRFFVIGLGTGVFQMAMYDFNPATSAFTYVGKIQASFPNLAATTHVIKGFKIQDSAGTTGWKAFIVTTGSVLINGGLFMVNNLSKADFVQVGFVTLPFATSDDQKAIYQLQDPATMGSAALLTAACGAILDATNNKIYVHNGLSATHQYRIYNTNATPTIDTTRTCTLAIASPGIAVFGSPHGLLVGDQVTFLTTGALPTGLTVGTVYFVSATSFSATQFSVALTSGGVAINFTGSTSGTHTCLRAFGQTGALFSHKTGNLTALAGVLLTSNSENKAVPRHSILSGFDCAFFMTTTNIYLGKLSELTLGATSWPSLITVNILGAVNEIVAPTPTYAVWQNSNDRVIYVTNAAIFVKKAMVNNQIDAIFGAVTNEWYEGILREQSTFGMAAIVSLENCGKWMAIAGSSVGQRVISFLNIDSSKQNNTSAIVSKVLTLDNPEMLKFVLLHEYLWDLTGSGAVYYRLDNFDTDDITSVGGWMPILEDTQIDVVFGLNQIQFMIMYDILIVGGLTAPFIQDVIALYSSKTELSDNWEGSVDYSTGNSITPAYSAFRMSKVYDTTAVPELLFNAYDSDYNLIVSVSTFDTKIKFDFSTDAGETWTSLVGNVIPNVKGTMLRYKWTGGVVQQITVSMMEK